MLAGISGHEEGLLEGPQDWWMLFNWGTLRMDTFKAALIGTQRRKPRLTVTVPKAERGPALDPNLPAPTLRLSWRARAKAAACQSSGCVSFPPAPSLTFSTAEAFQINVCSSLKPFGPIFRSGKGRVSSGNGQAPVGIERCEGDLKKERKKRKKIKKKKIRTPKPQTQIPSL